MASAYIGTTLVVVLFGKMASITGFFVFSIFCGLLLVIKIIMIETLKRKVKKRRESA
jgi:hypothetical protein